MAENSSKNASDAQSGMSATAPKSKTSQEELSADELAGVAGGHLPPEEIMRLHRQMVKDMKNSRFETK